MAISSSNANCKHSLTPVEHTVKKNEANKGRRFFRCAQWKNDDCGYFKWADGIISETSIGTSSANHDIAMDRRMLEVNLNLDRKNGRLKGDKRRLKGELIRVKRGNKGGF
ncbi:hypothetical protein RND81_06G214700 [Saponaria officinalis]|uniref:GRF-type domain-containing protein n=1 Tax=Saponaria officinalis TaxID=3572 RepID=A0AAW1KDM2_SAPOF